MDHFRANGYHTLGTGKLMHHLVRAQWTEYGNPADYGPFAFDGEEKVAHPDVPAPFSKIGPVDGSFGPFVSLAERTTPAEKPLQWKSGGWGKRARLLRVDSHDDRDLVTISVKLPPCLADVSAFEATAAGLSPVDCRIDNRSAKLKLAEIRSGRVFVLRRAVKPHSPAR